MSERPFFNEDEGCRIIDSQETDRELGMSYCEKLLRLEGKDVRTIIWLMANEEGHHLFTCCWTVKK